MIENADLIIKSKGMCTEVYIHGELINGCTNQVTYNQVTYNHVAQDAQKTLTFVYDYEDYNSVYSCFDKMREEIQKVRMLKLDNTDIEIIFK